MRHARSCPDKYATCWNCRKVGHRADVCKSKPIKEVSFDNKDDDTKVYNVNIFRLKSQEGMNSPAEDFKTNEIINNHLYTHSFLHIQELKYQSVI